MSLPLPNPNSASGSSDPPPTNYLAPDPSYVDPLLALAPSPRGLTTFARSLDPDDAGASVRLAQVFTAAYLAAASAGDSDLIEWLLARPDSHHALTAMPRHLPRLSAALPASCSPASNAAPPALLQAGEPRRYVNLDATDADGTPPIILAAAFGHPEAVRAIVDGVGGDVVDSRDAVGWTALHWATRNADFTIVSYLLNHGASTHLVSYSEHNPPQDRPASFSSRSRLSTFSASSSSTLASDAGLSIVMSACAEDSSTTTPSSKRARRSRGLRPYDLAKRGPEGDDIRHIIRMAEEARADATPDSPRSSSRASIKSTRTAVRKAQSVAALSDAEQLFELALLSARTLEFDFALLGVQDRSKDSLQSRPHTLSSDLTPHVLWEQEQRAEEFDWDRCLPDQMLVCSTEDLPILFDAVISLIEPQSSRTERFVPANVIFLSARFAAHFGTDNLLEELLLGAIDRIEEIVLARQENIANCAFWLFNSFTLLYYIQRDSHLNTLTSEIQMHFQDLINEIFVFIIRDAERRLDKIMDQSMLDFQPIAGFEHVQFEPEGSWRFVKALTVKRNRQSSVRASIPSFFSGALSPPLSACKARSSTLNSPSTATSPPMASTLQSNSSTKSPRNITDLFSSVLHLLQAYEIHASVVVQGFSQLFYWLACELFNRIITRRKYLCRSRAFQIRLNLLVLEDWARYNRLPPGLIQAHFKPIHQLLHWLQTLSNSLEFDKLIPALADLTSLNPLQILKAYREYRFEIDEPKLAEEGRQYLVQMQQDWDRRRLARKEALEEMEEAQREMTKGDVPIIDATQTDFEAVAAIDAAFLEPSSYLSYKPPAGPECLGELLDSRYMLPFALPSAIEVLVSLSPEVPFGPLKSFEVVPLYESEKEDYDDDDNDHEEEDDQANNEVTLKTCTNEGKVALAPVLSPNVLSRLDTVREQHRRRIAVGQQQAA